jgi:hypothetical protein
MYQLFKIFVTLAIFSPLCQCRSSNNPPASDQRDDNVAGWNHTIHDKFKISYKNVTKLLFSHICFTFFVRIFRASATASTTLPPSTCCSSRAATYSSATRSKNNQNLTKLKFHHIICIKIVIFFVSIAKFVCLGWSPQEGSPETPSDGGFGLRLISNELTPRVGTPPGRDSNFAIRLPKILTKLHDFSCFSHCLFDLNKVRRLLLNLVIISLNFKLQLQILIMILALRMPLTVL